MHPSNDRMAVVNFITQGLAIVAVYFGGLLFAQFVLGIEAADIGAAPYIGALIALTVALWGALRDRRIANIERMVKALYDRSGLDDGDSGRGRHGGK